MSSLTGRELLVLGLIRRGPLSAYIVSKAVRGHAHIYRALRSGNTYHHLARLEEAGYVRASKATARRGVKRDKAIYTLTPLGEKRFRGLLEAIVLDVQSEASTLEIAYVLLGQFSRAEAIDLLSRRRVAIADQQVRVRRLLEVETRGGSAYLAGSHAVSRLSAELEWLGESIERLQKPTWHPQWQQNDGPVEDPARQL